MPITATTAHVIANKDNGISKGNDITPDQFAGISTHFSTITPVDEDDRLKLLPFEQNLMVDSFISDILFIMARGLALERLFFNHLHMYSDQKATFLIINTTPEDEHFFLEKLRAHNPECPPKLIAADVLGKDREIIYKSGGVQFVTSRILMVDLLTERIPFDKVGGILVYRAHELLSGFQESFILRLFREKKPNGIIKAFTDNPQYIVRDGNLGQLQRLVNLLYIRQVIIVPRFHAEVKTCFETNAPKLTQLSIQLEPSQRKAQSSLRDIIATCIRELKQCTKDFDPESADTLTPAATLRITKLEMELKRRGDMPLTERQQRLLNDLHTLRALFQKIEDMDPTSALNFISYLRTNKEVFENNSGWLFTQSAATLFSNIDALCSLKDAQGERTIAAPAKWAVFCNILEEIIAKLVSENADSPVLVLVSNEQLSRQLIDLIKFGQRRYTWICARKITDLIRRDSISLAPPIEPVWNPVNVAYYDDQVFEKDHQDLRINLKVAQKEEAKKQRKRTKQMVMDKLKQPRLDRFGIQQFAKPQTPKLAGAGSSSSTPRENQQNGKKKKRSNPMNIGREEVPEGMLPEDPFTSFYEDKKRDEEIADIEGKPVDDSSIMILDEDNDDDHIIITPVTPPTEKGDNGAVPVPLPIRRFQSEKSPPRLNQSITEAARERAERSIHIIDEFHRSQEELELADPDLIFPPIPSVETFNQSLQSMLVFLELGNRYRLTNCLEQLKPKHVIMYNQEIAATRVIETFKALHDDHPLDLYVLQYEESSEEERYLFSIQRESEAIETLIKEQGLLMVPREFDLARESASQLRRLTMPQMRVDSRRKATTSSAQALEEEFDKEMRPTVIVDMREFNSELPTVLYRRGVDLHAATLEVGDYILSPDICCERKSLDDLAQSLLNGRIFKQVEQMIKHYKRCILLVESTEKYRSRSVRIGAFQGELSRRGRETRMLFAMLIRRFPQLDIFWSYSPAHSAEFFEELKLDQPNPLLEEALKKKRSRTEGNNNGKDRTMRKQTEDDADF